MIDNRFLANERELTEDNLRPYLQPLGRSLDLSPVDERIEEIRADDDITAQSSLIDAKLAPTLHRTLDLTRNEAADAGLWHYLCIVRFPEFVHYRWDHVFDPESPGNMEEKFLKEQTPTPMHCTGSGGVLSSPMKRVILERSRIEITVERSKSSVSKNSPTTSWTTTLHGTSPLRMLAVISSVTTH